MRTVLAVPRLCVLYPGICLTTEGETRKILSQGIQKVPAGHDSVCRHGRHLRVAMTSCRSRSPCFTGTGSKLGQRRCMPSCL